MKIRIVLASLTPVLLGVAPIQPARPLNGSLPLVYSMNIDSPTTSQQGLYRSPSPEDINYFIGRKCNEAFDEIKTIHGYNPAKAISVVIDSIQDVLTDPPKTFDEPSVAKQSEYLLHKYCLAHRIDKNNGQSVNRHAVEVVAYSCGLFIGIHLYHQLDKKYISHLKKGFEEASPKVERGRGLSAMLSVALPIAMKRAKVRDPNESVDAPNAA